MKKYLPLKILAYGIGLIFIFFCFLAFTNAKKTSMPVRNNKVITAQLSKDKRNVPLYGFNGEIIGGPVWTNDQFLDSVASLHSKIMRYPGGGVAEFWDWQNGYLESKLVLGRGNPRPKLARTKNGIDELALLVKKTHTDVVFVLNMTSRTVDDQIEMLKKAESLGIPVKYAELGNEFYAKESVGRLMYHTPVDYGKACKEWIDKIKEAFPDIKIAVIGGNIYYRMPEVDVSHWNSDVLDNAPNADAITAHIYPIPKNFMDGSDINYEKLIEEIVQVYNSRGFNSIKSNKDIWVTEYNMHWDEDRSLTNALTWAQGLAMVLMTSTLTDQSQRVQMFCNHNITTQYYGAIDGRKDNFNKTANGIGMETWLKASDEMSEMNKLDLRSSDYELFGWRFSNPATNASDILLVNLTDQDQKVDLSKIPGEHSKFETVYADKNTMINSSNDVTKASGAIQNNSVDLPKNSITVVKN